MKNLRNISGIDYEWNEDEEVALRRRMDKAVTDFRQQTLTDVYGNVIDTASKVLEIGCGCGRNAQYFNDEKQIQYYGFDSSQLSIDYFKKGSMFWKPDMSKCYVSTTMDETILGQEYDFIFSMFVLNHIGFSTDDSVHDSVSITKKLLPTLKKGGIWMSFELHQGQNAWEPTRWLRESFNPNDIQLMHTNEVTLFGTKGERLNNPHNLVIFRKK